MFPYAPRHTAGFLVGVRQPGGFGVQIDMNRVGGQFGDNRQTFAGLADGAAGLLPAYAVWNFAVDYTMHRERFEIKPYFTVKNLANSIYISSRAPQGIQPGMFRQANFGVKLGF